jgi:hypothetical protein
MHLSALISFINFIAPNKKRKEKTSGLQGAAAIRATPPT